MQLGVVLSLPASTLPWNAAAEPAFEREKLGLLLLVGILLGAFLRI